MSIYYNFNIYQKLIDFLRLVYKNDKKNNKSFQSYKIV